MTTTLLASPTTVRAQTDGALDPSFGVGGKVTTDFKGTSDRANAAAIQADGMLVAAGWMAVTSERRDFAVARYRPDGSLDVSFGNDGTVTTDVFGGEDGAMAVAVQADGRIVAAGAASPIAEHFDFALVRYMRDGSRDRSFGTDGVVLTDFGQAEEIANAVLIQTDGRIVAAGQVNTAIGPEEFALARYNSDGTLDPTFGVGGLVRTSFSDPAGAFFTSDELKAIAIQPDGRIVAGGISYLGHPRFALARYHTDGTLDDSFGVKGRVITEAGTVFSILQGLAIQVDGRIVAAGVADNRWVMARYHPDGSLDDSFGRGGVASLPVDGQAYSIEAQPDGTLVAAGVLFGGPTFGDVALMRCLEDGSPDPTFGFNGLVVTDLGGYDQAFAVLRQPDGRLVVAGEARINGTNDFALARYLSSKR